MSNENLIFSNQGSLPQHLVDIILKMNLVGNSQELICGILGLPIDKVRDVISYQIHDPRMIEQRVENFKIKSEKYRCSLSNIMMANPVVAPNGIMCERSEYDKLTKIGTQMKFRPDEIILVKPLKQEIMAFSISTLAVFQGYLQAEKVPESILQVIIECLSVLDPEINLATFQGIFDLSLKSQRLEIIQRLRDKAAPEFLLSLLSQMSKLPECRQQYTMLAGMLLKNDGVMDPNRDLAKDIFISALMNDNLSKKILKLAMELVDPLLSEERTDTMLRALRKHEGIREADAVMAELILKQVCFKVNQGKKDMALELLEPLYKRPELRKKIINFFDQLSWRNEKLKFMRDTYKQSLQRLEAHAPPGLIECLNLQQELNQENLRALKKSLEHKIEAGQNSSSQILPEVQMKEVGTRMEFIERQIGSIRNQLDTLRRNLSTEIRTAEINQTEAIAEQEARLTLKFEAFQDAILDFKRGDEIERVNGGPLIRVGGELSTSEPVYFIIGNDTKLDEPSQLIPTMRTQFIKVVDPVPNSQSNEPKSSLQISCQSNKRLSPDELLSKLKELITSQLFHLKSTLSERPVNQKCKLYNSVFYLMLQNKQSLAFYHLLEISLKEVTGDSPELRSEVMAHPSFSKVISKLSLLCSGNDNYQITEAEKTSLDIQLTAFCDTYRDASVATYLLKKLNAEHYNDAVTVITRYLHSTGGNSEYRQQITSFCKMLALHLNLTGLNYFSNNPTKVKHK